MSPISCSDALDWLRSLPSESADLVLTDPPYNIGLAAWDKIPNYVPWLCSVFRECARVTPPRGQLIFWHNDMPQLAEIMHELPRSSPWRLNSFITCVKPHFRGISWKNCQDDNTLRSWFNICEYCLVYTRGDAPGLSDTGLTQTYSLPEFSAGIRDYMLGELARVGLKHDKGLRKLFREWGQGGTGEMLRHYLTASQFEIPTRAIYEGFFQGFLRAKFGVPDLFPVPYDSQSSPEGLRQQFEVQRQQFEAQRPTHNLDPEHCNVWTFPEVNDGAEHPCRKPVGLLSRLVLTHSRPGDLIIDPFAGSGSTGEAALAHHRRFLGCERDPHYARLAARNISHVTPVFPALAS